MSSEGEAKDVKCSDSSLPSEWQIKSVIYGDGLFHG